MCILDALAPVTDEELLATADALTEALANLGENVQTTTRLIGAQPSES